MRALDKKLLRDLWRMRMHAIGVILVLACGLAMFVMAVGMRGSLERTRTRYYAERHMADLGVSLARAPDRVAAELAEAPGVEAVETRIAGMALLDLPNIQEPASARLVSLPRQGRPRVNDLVLARGRWPDPARAEEALVNQAFADALALKLGDRLQATLYGRRQVLKIVGVANSPEFVFVSAPGELFPQPARFGIIWMGREALARAYDLDGAFNEAVFRLGRGADRAQTISALDAILGRYGSNGVHGRDRMISDRYLSEEIKQLSTMAAFLPTFFLVIAAFLVNISLARVIATERSNIGLLKAFGYGDAAVAWHYAKSALILGALGALIGSAAGVAFGNAIAKLYRVYYHFPTLDFRATPLTFAGAWAAAFAAAGAGALLSVWRAARLSPAAALAPPRPASFRRMSGAIEALSARLDAKSRIILRRIIRFPRRALSTTIGVALAIALLVVARTFPAVMDTILKVHFSQANRQDATLTFIEAQEPSVLHEIERLPGVLYAEPFRIDDVVLTHDARRVQEAIFGLPRDGRLNRLIGHSGRAIEPPPDGLVLSQALAAKLDAAPGDEVEVAQTRGQRVRARVRVAGVAEPMVGSSAYMEAGALARLMREPGRISGAQILLDRAKYRDFTQRLKRTPALMGASFLSLAERSMRESMDRSIGFMNVIYATFAAVMAGGVAFSAARVTFAEQERDLATLRVLGFTRSEVSYVLIGELAALALFAVPIGVVGGLGLGAWLMSLFETDMYAFPFVFNPPGYAFAVGFTLACVLAAALVVRRDVDRLDMVAVLKARD